MVSYITTTRMLCKISSGNCSWKVNLIKTETELVKQCGSCRKLRP